MMKTYNKKKTWEFLQNLLKLTWREDFPGSSTATLEAGAANGEAGMSQNLLWVQICEK